MKRFLPSVRRCAALFALSCALLALPLAARAEQPEAAADAAPEAVSAEQNDSSGWMRLDRSELTLTLPSGTGGVYAQLTVTDSLYGGSISWSSSDTRVATVDSKGVVTARSTGTAVITARNSHGEYATCKVTVLKDGSTQPSHSTLNRTSMTLTQTWQNPTPRQQLWLETTARPGCYVYRWYSSDPSVASVDANGIVTALSVGSATITGYTTQGETLRCYVTVSSDIGKITLESGTLLLSSLGDQYRLHASVAVQYPSTVPLTWVSSDSSVARVSSSGVVTAVGDGSAVISVSSPDGHRASCTVYVGQAAEQYQRTQNITAAVLLGGTVILVGILLLVSMAAG